MGQSVKWVIWVGLCVGSIGLTDNMKDIGRVKVLDDSIFEATPEKAPPSTTKSAKGNIRYYDRGEPRDSVQGRIERERICGGLKPDMAAYRKCWAREKRKEQESLQKLRSNVESRMKTPVEMEKLENLPLPGGKK